MGVELEAQNFSPRSQSSIPMRFCARLSCVEFALLARARATCGATDGLYLLETQKTRIVVETSP
jgi:hypothetical protein